MYEVLLSLSREVLFSTSIVYKQFLREAVVGTSSQSTDQRGGEHARDLGLEGSLKGHSSRAEEE